MQSQVLHTVWCQISCEVAGEFWHWSLSGVKGLTTMPVLFCSSRSSSSSSETSEEEESEGREDSEENPSKAKWSLVCATAEEWEQLTEAYSKSKNRDEKLLHETLSVDFVPEIPKMIEAKVRVKTDVHCRILSPEINIDSWLTEVSLPLFWYHVNAAILLLWTIHQAYSPLASL